MKQTFPFLPRASNKLPLYPGSLPKNKKKKSLKFSQLVKDLQTLHPLLHLRIYLLFLYLLSSSIFLLSSISFIYLFLRTSLSCVLTFVSTSTIGPFLLYEGMVFFSTGPTKYKCQERIFHVHSSIFQVSFLKPFRTFLCNAKIQHIGKYKTTMCR